MKNKKQNTYPIISVNYDKEKNLINGYVYGKNSLMTLQGLYLAIEMVSKEYKITFDRVLKDMKSLREEIKKKEDETNESKSN